MKVLLRSLLCVIAVAILLAAVSSEAGENKKKNKGVRGSVVKVDADSLTVKTKAKKNATKEVDFKLNANTKVEKAGKKGAASVPAQIADIRVGSNVAVTGARGGVAQKVVIAGRKKKAG